MTDYTKTTDFAAKDSLPSGDSGKIIRGAEFETEFDNISTSIATKADLASPTFTGTATIPTAAVTALTLDGVAITATGSELNLLDGVTATTTELNYLDVTTLGEVEASKAVTADSSGDVKFPDSEKLTFGTSNDLQVYHDGSNSYIEDTGTGSLIIKTDGAGTVFRDSSNINLMSLLTSGEVKLFWSGGGVNAQKLTTNTDGISVTGITETDKFRLTNSGPPATSSSTGTAGDIAIDTNYIYVCVNTNVWKRVAIDETSW
jgi:hypothetical protein